MAMSIRVQQNQRCLPLPLFLGKSFCLLLGSPKPLHPTLAPSQSPQKEPQHHGAQLQVQGCAGSLQCSAPGGSTDHLWV